LGDRLCQEGNGRRTIIKATTTSVAGCRYHSSVAGPSEKGGQDKTEKTKPGADANPPASNPQRAGGKGGSDPASLLGPGAKVDVFLAIRDMIC